MRPITPQQGALHRSRGQLKRNGDYMFQRSPYTDTWHEAAGGGRLLYITQLEAKIFNNNSKFKAKRVGNLPLGTGAVSRVCRHPAYYME